MGSDESHFNVSLIVMDKVTRQRPQTTTLQQEAPALCMKAGYNNPTTTLLNNFAFLNFLFYYLVVNDDHIKFCVKFQ